MISIQVFRSFTRQLKAREIIGALANIPPNNGGVVPPEQVPSYSTHTRPNEDLEGFPRLIEA